MDESRFRKYFKSKKLRISSVLLATDALALILAAVMAYNFRFRSSLFETEGQPSIAAIDYQQVIGFIVLGWLFTFGISGIYSL
ncbi:MAG: hypothetical protein EBW15_07070, partial [Actinobacteria bacterium]|nr:hypothetical protein [Actinomycetota bacterium]